MKNYKIKNQNLNVPSESISTHCEALGLCLPEFINALVKGDLEFTGQRNFFFLLSNSDPVILHYKSTEPSTIKLRTSVCFLFVAPSYSRTTEFKKTCSYFNQSKDIVISSARLWLVEGQEEGRNFRCTVVQLYDGATETGLSALLSTNHRKAVFSKLETGVMIGWMTSRRFSFR